MMTKKRRFDDEILTVTTSPARVSRGRLRKRIPEIVGHPPNCGTPTHPHNSTTPTLLPGSFGAGFERDSGTPTHRAGFGDTHSYAQFHAILASGIREILGHPPHSGGTNSGAQILGHPPGAGIPARNVGKPTQGIVGHPSHPPTQEFRDTHDPRLHAGRGSAIINHHP